MNRLIKNNIYNLCFITSLFVFIFFVFSLFFYTIKVNPVKLKTELSQTAFTLLPQGWAFFTRSPREAQVLIYKSDYNKNFKEVNQRHSSYKNIFGLNRQASKMIAELQFIKKEINDTLYTKTEWNYQANNFGLIPTSVIDVKNQFKDPLLCGEYLLVFQKSIPWAWSKNIEKIKMPSKIIRIKIECL